MGLWNIIGRDNPLPVTKGLFGTKLRTPSIVNLNADREREGGGFKYLDDRDFNPHEWGWPYDYEGDLEYRWIIGQITSKIRGTFDSNLVFLKWLKEKKLVLLPEFLMSTAYMMSNGPILAPEPETRNSVAYVWPSYIVWPNDPSYLSFLGSPESMELPKHVLRETRGHPQFRDEPRVHTRHGVYPPRFP